LEPLNILVASERPNWSDADGQPLALSYPPDAEREGENGWYIVRSPATDPYGWQYGTGFDKLNERRAGGRASKRAGDMVRTRKWVRHPQQQVRPHVIVAP
jgi:hypothetical protein